MYDLKILLAVNLSTGLPWRMAPATASTAGIKVKPHDAMSLLDIRTARLPHTASQFNDYNPLDHKDPPHKIKLHPDERFYRELIHFSMKQDWTCGDTSRLQLSLGAFTFVSEAHGSRRWLDSCVVTDSAVHCVTDVLWMAYFDILRTMCGAGMLGMPLAISQMGILLGPIITLATGFLIIGTHNLLLKSLYEVARQLRIPYISYRYGFRIALLHGPPIIHWLGHHGPTIIAIFMVASQLATCALFVVFTTDCLRDLMDWDNSEPAQAWLFFPYLVMEFFMKDLSIVSYVAMSGNFLNLAGMIIVFVHMFTDNTGETMSIETSVLEVLFGFGILLFNLSNVGVILSIDKSLVDTRQITSKFGVLNVGLICPTILGMVFGSLGYYAFGTMEENVIRVLPYDDMSTMVSIALYLIAVAFAYPIQCYPAIATIVEVIKYHDENTSPSLRTMQLIEGFARPIFVTLSFLICYIVPFQGPLIAFVGNLCTTMLQLVFPVLMDIGLRYPYNYGYSNYRLYLDLSILFLGLASFVFGVYHCGYLLHIRFLSKHSPNNNGFD